MLNSISVNFHIETQKSRWDEKRLREEKKTRALSSKTKYNRGTMTIDTIASSMAKETESILTVDTNKACSNKRS